MSFSTRHVLHHMCASLEIRQRRCKVGWSRVLVRGGFAYVTGEESGTQAVYTVLNGNGVRLSACEAYALLH